FPVRAASDSAEDIDAADLFRILTNWTFSDPILSGRYPEDWVAELVLTSAGLTAQQLEDDLVVVLRPLDHSGRTYYEPTLIDAPPPGKAYSGGLAVDLPA